jgi:hypothetical protein
MKRLCMLALVLFLCPGCAKDQDQWADFWRDVNGDNMKMRNEGSMFSDAPPLRAPSHDSQ